MSSDSAASSSRVKRRLLQCGLVLGLCMVIVPFLSTAIGIWRASRVPDGLRGATHIPAMQSRVGFALGSASLTAILAPPGLMLIVFSGLALASEKKVAKLSPPGDREDE